MRYHTDYLVIGAGVAGASIAAELARNAEVVLLDPERSPAPPSNDPPVVFTEICGSRAVRALTVASYPFFDNPPLEFPEPLLWSQRPLLMIAREDQLPELLTLHRQASSLSRTLRILGPTEIRARAPMLRSGYAAAGLLEEDSSDLDASAIRSGFVRFAELHGAQIARDAEVLSIREVRSRKVVATRAGEFSARIVVNAADARAGSVGKLAGAMPIGLRLRRRSAFTFAPSAAPASAAWPTIVDVSRKFHLKTNGERILGSSGDDPPVPDRDVSAAETHPAQTIDRIRAAIASEPGRVEPRWGGVRGFVADETPVVGFDDRLEGFFWCAALGGYGVQTAPALARAAASLLRGSPFPEDLVALGLDRTTLSPKRLKSRLRLVAGEPARAERQAAP